MRATCDDAHDGTIKPDLEADVEHALAATDGEVRYVVEARKLKME
jgi:hypothetical protein